MGGGASGHPPDTSVLPESPVLGIVIPVFGSTLSLLTIIEDIRLTFTPICTFRIYLVDDGNPPDIGDWLVQNCAGLPHVTLIRLKRNYGQQNAVLCGIRHSLCCRYIATMDDDLQHDVNTLLALYQTILEGFDIVYAVPGAGSPPSGAAKSPKSTVRFLGSRMRDLLFRTMLKLPRRLKVSSFRVMTGALAREITTDASGFFYLSAAVFRRPRKAKTLFYKARPRAYGKSGYTLPALVKLYGNILRFYSPLAPVLTTKKRRQTMLYEEADPGVPGGKTIMILGGSNCQLHALERARYEGHRVILADYTPSPPGAPLAHIHCRVSTFDVDACIEAAKTHRADAVMTIGTDQPVYTAACISRSLGLPSSLSPQEALAVTNKKMMKQVLTDHGIPTVPWLLIDSHTAPRDLDGLTPPLVIKPLDSQGQRGIFKCATPHQLLSCLPGTLSFSRCTKALAEQFYPGDEITVSGWVRDGQLTVLTVTDRLLYPDPVHIGICIGHRFPSIHMNRYEEIYRISDATARAFQLKEGPFYLQLLIGQEGIRVNELACRIGGAFEDVTIPWLTGFDILKAVMDLSLGRPAALDLPKDFRPDRTEKQSAVQLLFGRPGEIASLTPVETLRQMPFLLDCGYNYRPGQKIPAAHNATARLGHGVITGTPDTIASHIDEFYRNLKILSPAGENLVTRLYPAR